VRIAWSAFLALSCACYDPTFQVGLPCSPGGDCPTGQVCAADQTCQLSDQTRDAAPGDGGSPDAMPLPLESWFVSFQHPDIARASDVARVAGGFALVGSSLVAVLDPTGAVRWQRDLDIGAYAVAGVPGGMIVGGSAGAVGLSHDGEIRWQKSYADQESSTVQVIVPIAGTDDAVLVGFSSDADDLESPWLVRIDGSGDIVWQQRFTAAVGVYAWGATATDDGGVVVVGVTDYVTTLDERDLVAFKVDGDGDLRWAKRVSGGDNEWGSSAGTGVAGEVWLVGGTWSNSFGAADLWVLRVDEGTGDIESQHRIGTDAQDNGSRIFPTAATGAMVVGETGESGNTDLLLVEIKDDAIASQFRIGTGEGEIGAGAAYGPDGLVVFGDTDAFNPTYGFFAVGLPMADGLESCAHSAAAGAGMATASATASNLDFTVTATSATATDLDGAATPVEIGTTAECP
jgi:hypothetical protein